MTAKLLVLGFDGFDPQLVHKLGDTLPNLRAMMSQGVFAPLESVKPCATLPNWSTFLTTSDPGEHGVFDFTTRHGYRVRFSAGTVRAVPTMFRDLDALGQKTACIGFPATWPPEKLSNGIFIAGWDSPVDFEADKSFMWPPSLHDVLRTRFGPWRFDDADEFHADASGFYDALGDTLVKRIARKTEIAAWLLQERAWDVFAFYFGESDTACHHLWAHFDEASPRHPSGASSRAKSGLPRVYAALDAALGTLRGAAGGDATNVVIVSDHGSGGASDKVWFLNKQLADWGWLRFAPSRGLPMARPIKDLALRALPPKLRQRAFRSLGRALPGWLESQNRFGNIDFSQTRAFSDELNYFPAISLNMSEREPQGIVRKSERERAIRDLTDALLAVRDPWRNERVVTAAHPRESLYAGPFVERAPDLIIELALDSDGYSFNLMPSRLSSDGNPWMRLARADHLGRKGRSLPGSHRSHGVFFAAGPDISHAPTLTPTMADASRTVRAIAGIEAPPYASGRVLTSMLAQQQALASPSAPTHVESDAATDEALVEARLRALGYVE